MIKKIFILLEKKKIITGLTIGLFIFSNIGLACATLIGPTSYLSFNDSPFKATNFSYFYLEDFEDLMLNTPGASVDHGIPINNTNSGAIDSVDGDDGVIDGYGGSGSSIFDPTSMMFTFDESILGTLPTHAGLVFTDGTSGGLFTFEAFDRNLISLGSVSAYLGDSSFWGTTEEDRFFGITNLGGGISSISITDNGSFNYLEVDHLQYGAAAAPVPEPTTMLLFGIGLIGLAGLGIRREKQ